MCRAQWTRIGRAHDCGRRAPSPCHSLVQPVVAVGQAGWYRGSISLEYADAPAREPPGGGDEPYPSFGATPEVLPQYLLHSPQAEPTHSGEPRLSSAPSQFSTNTLLL